jgi:hypothetical protein
MQSFCRTSLRFNVVEVLGEIGEPSQEIAAALTEALRDDMPWLHCHITNALRKIGYCQIR